MNKGYCVKGSCSCNGDSSICQLNPKAGVQTEFSFAAGGVVPVKNCDCCHFRVMDLAKHSQ